MYSQLKLLKCLNVLPACLRTACVPGALGHQKRALDPQTQVTVVRFWVGPRTLT